MLLQHPTFKQGPHPNNPPQTEHASRKANVGPLAPSQGAGPPVGWLGASAGGGYLEDQDEEEEAEGWHVEPDGDKAGERREQIEEVGLVQPLQQVVQLPEDALEGPAGRAERGLQLPMPGRDQQPQRPPRASQPALTLTRPSCPCQTCTGGSC